MGGDVYAHAIAGYAVGMHSYTSEALGVNKVSAGSVTAVGYTGAKGIDAEGGYVTVHVSGDVFADATHSGDAVGVYVKGDSSTYIGGNAVAISAAGNATAVQMVSTGGAYVTVHQNVYAKGAIEATGVTNKGYDYTTVTVGGNVTALAGTGNANGVYAYSKYGTTKVTIGGDVEAISTGAKAYGVTAEGAVYAYANITGNVVVEGPGIAVGVQAIGADYAEITVGGNVTASSTVGEAIGVLGVSAGDVDETVDGVIFAYSVQNDAIGAFADSDSTATVTVGGSVEGFSKYSYATGVSASAAYNADVYVTGTAFAVSVDGGNATAVYAQGGNYARVYAGNIVAEALHGVAFGVYATGGNGTTVDVSGDVEAVGLISATGVYAYSKSGYGNVTVGGNVLGRVRTGPRSASN